MTGSNTGQGPCDCTSRVRFARSSNSSKDLEVSVVGNSSFQQSIQQHQQPAAASSSSSSNDGRFAERTAGVRPDRLDLQLLQDKTDEGSGGSSYVRGTTVCLAALGKSKTTTNDSDEVCGGDLQKLRAQLLC
jgi:hypothetical protein